MESAPNGVQQHQSCSYGKGTDLQCRLAAVPGHELCIFHLPMEKKDQAKFWQQLARHLRMLYERTGSQKAAAFFDQRENPMWFCPEDETRGVTIRARPTSVASEEAWRFRGFVFPPMDDVHHFKDMVLAKSDFSEAVFTGPADFSSTEFDGPGYFVEAQFGGPAEFDSAHFGGLADFAGAQFKGKAEFHDVKFGGKTRFMDAQFSECASFWNAEFDAEARFSDADFGGEANFLHAHFSNDVDFFQAQFRGVAHLDAARFEGSSSFGFAHFHAQASFRQGRFDAAAFFKSTRFDGPVNFLEAWFRDSVFFNDATFGENHKHGSTATFLAAEFGAETSFYGATFNDDVIFESAHFAGPTYFSRATIRSRLDLGKARLLHRLLFEGTQIANSATVLLWGLDFLPSRLSARSIAMREEPSRDSNSGMPSVEPTGQVVFQDIAEGMDRVSFLHTGIMTDRPLFWFWNVNWSEKDPRKFIFDAKFVRSRSEWSKSTGLGLDVHRLPGLFNAAHDSDQVELLVKSDVERIAREIRKSYEAFGNYSDAGDFHIAEMEYRRIQAGWPKWFSRLILEGYRCLSLYGESPGRAFVGLSILWLVFALLYPLLGLSYGSATGLSFLSLFPFLSRIQGDAAMQVNVVRLASGVQALLGTSVLTLFLLALRRRFRR